MHQTKQAFTLIELLVVVLIIGILAAIALPQYEKAVEKSRLAEGMQILGSLRQAVDLYVLENGYSGMELIGDGGATGKLSVDAESTLNCDLDDGDKCCSKYLCYDAYCGSNGCWINAIRYKNTNPENDEEYEFGWEKTETNGWTKHCTVNNDKYSYVCTSFNSL